MSLLEDYIKDSNRLETSRNKKPFSRIESIDFIMGVSFCLVILIYISGAWLDGYWANVHLLLYTILDAFGPSLFIFLSVLSVVFLIKEKSNNIPKHMIRNKIFIRGIIIMLLGVVYNINSLSPTKMPFPLNLWGWNLLMFIGIAHVLTYYIVMLSRGVRAILGISIIFMAAGIRNFLYIGKDINPVFAVLHYIIVSPMPHNPLIPYLAICFFSSIFGELLFEAVLLETKEAYIDAFRSFIKYGLLFTFIGIMIPITDGYFFVIPNEDDLLEYPYIELISIMRDLSFAYIPGIPGFLLRGTPPNQFYSLGIALLIIGVSFYYIDIKHQKNSFINVLSFYGKSSITLFLLNYFWLSLFVQQLNILVFFPAWLGYLGLLGFILYIWKNECDEKLTFEWMLDQLVGKKKN